MHLLLIDGRSSAAGSSSHPFTAMSLIGKLLICILMQAMLLAAAAAAGERGGAVDFSITVDAPRESRSVKLWFPYPTSDREQEIKDLKFNGNYSKFAISREPQSG